MKRQQIICSSYFKIKRSRNINKQIGAHYIPSD
jgi:hypothetical protein